MALNSYDIIVPGHYFCDVIFTGLPAFPALGTEIFTEGLSIVPGGGGLNTAVALRRLGVNAGWIGALGDDFCSRFVEDYLAAETLDLSMVMHTNATLRRMTVALSYPADRAFVSYVDPTPNIVDLVSEALRTTTCRHLHFPGLLVDERLPSLLERCRQRGMTISMDCQHRQETLASPLVRDILSRIDLFMPNAGEAQRITGETTLDAAAKRLLDVVPTLVVKDSANGAHFWQDERYLHSPAYTITPLDTTGAGDCFNAGFLAARLSSDDPAEWLRWGNRCGALSTRGYGGSGAPTLDEVLAE